MELKIDLMSYYCILNIYIFFFCWLFRVGLCCIDSVYLYILFVKFFN